MRRAKVSIIGAGHVGETIAILIAREELADVVLLDILPGIPKGKGLDIAESSAAAKFDSHIAGTSSYEEISHSDIVVVTAGLPRKPGMTREDLLKKNASIITEVAKNIKKYSPDSIVIMVTNPLDVMSYLLWKVTSFSEKKVVGQAGVLDSARFSYFIAEELDVSTEDIAALVLGGHGDSMVPLPRYTTVSGIPITELLDKETIDSLIERTRKGGDEIVNLLNKGSAYYAPAQAVYNMAESIIKDKKRILPSSCYLSGEYGLKDIFMGVPAKLGSSGVEEIIELELKAPELASLKESAKIYKKKIQIALEASAHLMGGKGKVASSATCRGGRKK